MKAKESKSNSMIEKLGNADVDTSLGNTVSDKTNPNNKSVAITSVDMSRILPQIEEE